ncbi:MAG: hypothetical protein ABIJ61_07065 [bacterium]
MQRANDSNWVGGMYLYDTETRESTLIYDNYWAYSPTWSPDGEWIAYSLWGQLFRMKLNGDSVVQLTTWGLNRRCCWSPAGSLIAYDKTAVGLWLCNADSSNHRLLYEHAGYVSWYLDGFRMAALGLGGEIYIIDTLGERYEQITANDEFKYDLDLSPNGEMIVFTQQLSGRLPNLWIVDVGGKNLTRLTSTGGRHPDWSPDGEWIVYTNLAYGNGHLWLMRPDGSEKHQITFPAE